MTLEQWICIEIKVETTVKPENDIGVGDLYKNTGEIDPLNLKMTLIAVSLYRNLGKTSSLRQFKPEK